jgi:hypothetical protein
MDRERNGPPSSDPIERPGGSTRKPYRAPQLIEYGSVAKLTQSSAGSGADGSAKAGKMKTCL